MFDNNMNNNFNNRPLFNNYNNQELNNEGYNKDSYENNSNDLPPVLDEIKNLTDSPISEAPTLDALGPANFIPESDNNIENDPISLYEKGNINLNNQSDNLFNNISNNYSNLTNNINEYNYDTKVINNENNNNLFDSEFTNNSFNLSKDNFNNDFLNKNNNDEDFNISNKGLVDTYKVNESNQFNNTDYGYDSINVLDNNLNDSKDYIINNNNINNLDMENNYSIYEPSKDYEINNDILISQKEEKDSLSDLDIMDSYDDADMLEIMDIDSEDVNEKINDNKKVLEENINKIKKLIDEIKDLGVNVSLEEFDFESMYQIIIKLNKD